MTGLRNRALAVLCGLALVASTGVGLAGPASAASATTTVHIRVFSQNIEGAVDPHHDRLAKLDALIAAFKPQVVLIEEICLSQVRSFLRQHPHWSAVYSRMRGKQGCPTAAGKFPKSIGEMVASPYPMSDEAHYVLPGYLRKSGEGDEVPRTYHLTCADIHLPHVKATAVRACVTHTRSGHKPHQGYRDTERLRQTRAIARLTARFIRAGQFVILGGDFNARPEDASLNPIYRLSDSGHFTGRGNFLESDQTDRSFFPSGCYRHCRSGAPTVDTAHPAHAKRYDYIFFSRGRNLHGERLASDGSDHLPIRSRVTVTLAR